MNAAAWFYRQSFNGRLPAAQLTLDIPAQETAPLVPIYECETWEQSLFCERCGQDCRKHYSVNGQEIGPCCYVESIRTER